MSARHADLYATASTTLRVALCQIETREWDVDGNLERLLAGLESAARQGAHIAVTPECVFHGYGFAEVDFARRLSDAAEPLDGARVGAVRDAARRLGIDVLLGFAERGDGGAVHNSAALLTRDGAVAFVYRKVHCRPFEPFAPGDRFCVADRPGDGGAVRVGALVCFDREVPEATRCVRALGAQIVLCPLATPTSPMDMPVDVADNEVVTRVRAAENEVFYVVVNHAGRFNGGSFAVGPYGDLFVQLGAAPEVRTVALPVGVVRDRLHADPLGWMGWGYRRPEVYAAYLG